MVEVIGYKTYRFEPSPKPGKYLEIGDILSNPGPCERSYKTSKFCVYPHEIVLQLDSRSVVSKLEILVHHELVPKYVKITLGDVPPGRGITLKLAQFQDPIGTVPFEDPADEAKLKGRELKFIEFTGGVPITLIKLHFGSNFELRSNKFNQIGIIGISIIGRRSNFNDLETPFPIYGVTSIAYIDDDIKDEIYMLETQKKVATDLGKMSKVDILKGAIAAVVEMGYEHGKLLAEATKAAKEGNNELSVSLVHEAEHLKLLTYDNWRVMEKLRPEYLRN